MRNVSHILEKQLTDYLVTDQARFYRLAYSYLKNRRKLHKNCLLWICPQQAIRLLLFRPPVKAGEGAGGQ